MQVLASVDVVVSFPLKAVALGPKEADHNLLVSSVCGRPNVNSTSIQTYPETSASVSSDF